MLSTYQSDTVAPPLPRQHLESTQDLLARFNLHSAYDRYVRPSILTSGDAVVSGMGAGASGGLGDKGKGKEVDVSMSEVGGNTGSEALPGAADGEDEDGPGGKGDKKMKNSYRHLIKGLPGEPPLPSLAAEPRTNICMAESGWANASFI